MNERYTVTSRGGEAVIRTNSREEAEWYSVILRGAVLDREAVTVAVLS